MDFQATLRNLSVGSNEHDGEYLRVALIIPLDGRLAGQLAGLYGQNVQVQIEPAASAQPALPLEPASTPEYPYRARFPGDDPYDVHAGRSYDDGRGPSAEELARRHA